MKTKAEINEQRRKRRVYNKIKNALNNNNFKCLFLTMTFKDSILNNTSAKSRERYIKDYLNKETAFYILNKDYGKTTQREHYHAFIIVSYLNVKDVEKHLKQYVYRLNFYAYKYGNIKADFIASRYKTKDKAIIERVSNHFFKDSTNKSRIIASRKKPTKEQEISRLKRLYDDEIKHKKKRR